MSQPLMLGFTGKRLSGKSSCADWVTTNYPGWTDVHAFNPGKAMCVAYYRHLGCSKTLADQLVYGVHKDTPFKELYLTIKGTVYNLADVIPGPNSRYFMEKLGKHVGTNMGEGYESEFTLMAELGRVKRLFPEQNIILQSIVYEADKFRALGGTIVKVIRPGQPDDGKGIETDKFVESLEADYDLINDGTKVQLYSKVDKLLAQLGHEG